MVNEEVFRVELSNGYQVNLTRVYCQVQSCTGKRNLRRPRNSNNVLCFIHQKQKKLISSHKNKLFSQFEKSGYRWERYEEIIAIYLDFILRRK